MSRRVGRYVLFDEIAAGGMATVHFGRLIGPAGFARTVAIKRLHPQFAKDPEFVTMFLDEARLAARVRHPNVVPMLDIVTEGGEMLLVMEYISGATFSFVLRALREKREAVAPPLACAIIVGALTGLHAAHEATSEDGALLELVHRDVSPQNILVGNDGVVRVADFGIAKAVGRLQTTAEGQIKGKSGYMAPEQIRGREVDRRTDVYGAGVVLWEALTGERLFNADNPLGTMTAVLEGHVDAPSTRRANIPSEIDAIVMRAIARKPEARFSTARDMAVALESALRLPTTREVGEWVELVAGDMIKTRAGRMREIETSTPTSKDAPVAQDDIEVHATNTANAHVSEITPRPSRRLTAAKIAAPLALIAAVGIGAFTWRHNTRTASVAAPTSSSPVVETATAPSATVASSIALPSPLAESASATRVSTSTPKTHVSTVVDKPRCNPPYTIDASGVRHWKTGC